MSKAKVSHVTGEVTSIKDGYEISPREYWVDVTIKDLEGHFVNVNYSFSRESIRENIKESLKKGMNVTAHVDGEVDLDNIFDYKGVGSIKINDLSRELSAYVESEFLGSKVDAFNRKEISLIEKFLEEAKHRIPEQFNVNEETLAEINRKIDDLKEKTPHTTKYDWKKLFLSCVVGISMDLGFGLSIPEVLFNLFKDLIKEFINNKSNLLEGPSPRRP